MESPIKHNTTYVVKISLVAALGGLLFGYDTAVISGAIGFLRSKFGLDAAQMGWAASCALVGCIIGCTFAGMFSDWAGRKKTLILAAVMFAVSAIGSAVSGNVTEYIIFRIIGGIGVGTASMMSPLYIAEISPASIRGRMVSYNQFAIVSGMLVVYFVNYFIASQGNEAWNVQIGWRLMFGSETLPALLFLGFLFFVPESPRWLVKQKRTSEALSILSRVGGGSFARKELIEIEDTIIHENGSFHQFFQPGLRLVLIIGIVLAVLQQVTGINVFLYYAPEIFKKLGTGTNAALFQTIMVGAVNLLFTVVAIRTVDRLGRKPLMLFGSMGMGICLISLGLSTYFQQTALWVLIFILGYIAFFALSVGPVTWVILSEIFPTRIRGRAMSIATICLWASNLLVSQTFPMIDENQWLVDRFHHAFSFWLYGFMCIILVLFVWLIVPETKGRSLEEI
ncbi:MAG: sugar porter family MFS transporter, partial [Candidatus Aminicenantes bacterium]|nr:sugar porter family MFS transporter [Candidatus Aminicenantes bacterium]